MSDDIKLPISMDIHYPTCLAVKKQGHMGQIFLTK